MPTLRRRPPRRGATLILVAVLTVPLVGLAALAVDVSWWQVGANQLQTSADAAALAGARALQQNPAATSAQSAATDALVRSYASTLAESNKAFAQTVSVSGTNDVAPRWWNPDTRTATPVADWSAANAVEVTARVTPGLILGGLVRSTAPAVSRTGVAWVANLRSITCPKPFGLPYPALQSLTGSANDPLTATDLDALDNLSELQRTIVILPPGLANSYVPPTPNVGAWAPMVYDGSASFDAYRDMVQGINCAAQVATLDASTQPSSGNNIPNGTTANLVNIGVRGCYGPPGSGNGNTTGGNGNPTGSTPPGNSGGGNSGGGNSGGGNSGGGNSGGGNSGGGNSGGGNSGGGNSGGNGDGSSGTGSTTSALCYTSAAQVGTGTPGVTVTVAWVAPSGGSGSNANTVKMLGEFKIMCYFSATTDRCGNAGSWTPNLGANAYPEGTIVGVVAKRTFLTLGQGEQLGTTPSTSQRLVLVH